MALRSSIVRRGIRSVACFHRREIFGVPNIEIRSRFDEVGRQFLPYLRFYTAAASRKHTDADTGLVRVVDSEIESIEHERQIHSQVAPDEFPFEIQDNPEERNIFLIRKYQDEIIKVEVQWPGSLEGDDAENNDNQNAQRSSYVRPSIPLTVNVSKGGEAETLMLEVIAFPDEIQIDGWSLTNSECSEDEPAVQGSRMVAMQDNFQNALIKYLDNRGINLSLSKFLFNYIGSKDYSINLYFQWLKALKGFIEK